MSLRPSLARLVLLGARDVTDVVVGSGALFGVCFMATNSRRRPPRLRGPARRSKCRTHSHSSSMGSGIGILGPTDLGESGVRCMVRANGARPPLARSAARPTLPPSSDIVLCGLERPSAVLESLGGRIAPRSSAVPLASATASQRRTKPLPSPPESQELR
jgi:hypothetical protein